MSEASSNPWNPTLEVGPYTDVALLDPDCLIARCGGELLQLECSAELVAKVLSLLAAKPSFDTLAQQLGIPRAEFEPFVKVLLDAALVRIVDQQPADSTQPYVSSLVLTGDGLVADELLRMLHMARLTLPIFLLNMSGDGRVTLSPADRDPIPGATDLAPAQCLEDILAALPNPMLIGAPDNLTQEDLLAINASCLQTDTPWLPIYFDGQMMRVGPTVLPYRSPCFGCLLTRMAFDHRLLVPELPGYEEFRCLRDTWPFPMEGLQALSCLKLIPDCLGEIVALVRGDLPQLIGRQLYVRITATSTGERGVIAFEGQSDCPGCYCGTRAKPARWLQDRIVPPEPFLRLSSYPVQHVDGGLRTIAPAEAHQLISTAFARFGTTFRVERCHYGPLGQLPSYHSYSTGYLRRELPYLIPNKLHTGKGLLEVQAYLSAAYEMAERVSAAYHGQQPVVQARIAEVKDLAVDLTGCLGECYLDLAGYDRPTNDLLVDWVWGESLVTGRRVLVPASMVFFPQQRFHGMFKPQWSGGLAAGSTLPDAVLQGLLERVEHDAWAVWQLNRIACPRVDTESISDPDIQRWIGTVREAGFELLIRDRHTELGISTFRVWLISQLTPQAFACRGDGAHLDPIIALKRALTEAQHKLAFPDPYSWQQVLMRPSAELMNEERSLYALSGLTPFELADTEPTVDFGHIPSMSSGEVTGDIRTIVKRITTSLPRSDVVVVDLTDAVLEIPVVRVLTVGLQEMAKPWMYVLPRTFALPVQMGRRARILEYYELYHGPFPH